LTRGPGSATLKAAIIFSFGEFNSVFAVLTSP
jgi:hypothetical protein